MRQQAGTLARLRPVSRLLRILSTALITAGLVVLADVALTIAYKEPISSVYGEVKQDAAEDQLAALESSYPSATDLRAISGIKGVRRKARILARRFAPHAHEGDAIGRIVIPKIDLNSVIVQGTDTPSLRKGPGHYPETPFPGQGGTSAIAGHRTTYLAPFRQIDSMGRGDSLSLEMPYATFTYRVEKAEIVDPSQVGVVRRTGHERLVLTACHPLYSADQRYVVFLRLTGVAVFDAARGGPWPA
jgi:sortase A